MTSKVDPRAERVNPSGIVLIRYSGGGVSPPTLHTHIAVVNTSYTVITEQMFTIILRQIIGFSAGTTIMYNIFLFNLLLSVILSVITMYINLILDVELS